MRESLRSGATSPWRWSILSAVLLLLAPGAALAGDGLVTDRPDQAETSETVGAGHIQIEVGGDAEMGSTDGGPITRVRTPSKLRFGLTERWEVHLESDLLGLDVSDDGSGIGTARSGISDFDVGFKWNFFAPDEQLPTGVPSVAVLGAVSGPFGSEGFGAGTPVSTLLLIADFDLPGEFGLGTNLGLALPLEAGGGLNPGYRYAAAFSHPLAPISTRVDAYFEFYGEGGFAREDESLLALDSGFTYMVVPVMQLDVYLRAGVLADRPLMGGGVGVSYRI